VPGVAQSALPELSDHAPKLDGQSLIVGPSTPDWTEGSLIEAVREVGFRRRDDHSLVPIVHAKILLLGTMMWTDEHPSGHVDDHIWFELECLWVGSAVRQGRRRLGLVDGASRPAHRRRSRIPGRLPGQQGVPPRRDGTGPGFRHSNRPRLSAVQDSTVGCVEPVSCPRNCCVPRRDLGHPQRVI